MCPLERTDRPAELLPQHHRKATLIWLKCTMLHNLYGCTGDSCTHATGAPAKHHMRICALESKAADANRAAASSIHITRSRHAHRGRGATTPLPRQRDGAGRRRRAAQRAADVQVDGCEVGYALCLAVFEPAEQGSPAFSRRFWHPSVRKGHVSALQYVKGSIPGRTPSTAKQLAPLLNL